MIPLCAGIVVAIGVSAWLTWADRRRCRWANVTGSEDD